MSAFALSQILVGVAFLFGLASFQFKKREVTLTFLSAAGIFLSSHFFLLGASTAGVVVAVSAVRLCISIFTTNVFVKYACLAVVLCVGIYTFDGVEDIFALLAATLGTFGAFQRDEKLMRTFMMLGSSSYVVHNVLIWTPGGIALEIFFLCSNLVSYYRFYVRSPSTT